MRRQRFLMLTLTALSCNFFVHAIYNIRPLSSPSRKITIIGTGYVGLITGAGLAEIGHRVTCVDINKKKIAMLNNGDMPIFEPSLQDIVFRNVTAGRLTFRDSVAQSIMESDIIIVAVGTPTNQLGRANLSALESVFKTIGDNLNEYKIICIKSTVPVGTNERMKSLLKTVSDGKAHFDIVSNPEFLRAGCALKDFFERTPIVLGGDSPEALRKVADMFHPLIENGVNLIMTNVATAELIKYAWNIFSATKIGYVNEIANLCDAVDADIATVVQAMSFSDKILPVRALRPGPGIGGSCLPKDMQAAVAMAAQRGVDLSIARAVIKSNDLQKVRAVSQLMKLFDGSVKGKTIAVLGLSFKPGTDDVRNSPAIVVLERLLGDGACVQCYDPQAMENMKGIIPNAHYCQSAQEALRGADALLLLADWEEFKDLNLDDVASWVTQKIIVDTRNIWKPTELSRRGFRFANSGRRV